MHKQCRGALRQRAEVQHGPPQTSCRSPAGLKIGTRPSIDARAAVLHHRGGGGGVKALTCVGGTDAAILITLVSFHTSVSKFSPCRIFILSSVPCKPGHGGGPRRSFEGSISLGSDLTRESFTGLHAAGSHAGRSRDHAGGCSLLLVPPVLPTL